MNHVNTIPPTNIVITADVRAEAEFMIVAPTLSQSRRARRHSAGFPQQVRDGVSYPRTRRSE